jgi:hypothetical protein
MNMMLVARSTLLLGVVANNKGEMNLYAEATLQPLIGNHINLLFYMQGSEIASKLVASNQPRNDDFRK